MDIQKILENHKIWLTGSGGARADLSGADLYGANLRGAHLSRADLGGADLCGADLGGANLSGANLYMAHLRGAHLRGADLRGADLSWADLSGANLRGASLPDFQIPQDEDLKVWKKLAGNLVAGLLIPKGAKRTASLVGDKCRAEYVQVLSIVDAGGREVNSGLSMHDEVTKYEVGQIVRPDSYDDDPRVECTHGIHFFMERKSAEDY